MMKDNNNNLPHSNSDNQNSEKPQEKILWSSISRNGTILVEAGEDQFDGAVSETAKGVLTKRNTPGWEYYNYRPSNKSTPKLKAVKFHVYEHHYDTEDYENDDVSDVGEKVWVFAAVYNPQAWETSTKDILPDVQAFIQKLVGLTEMERLSDPSWRNGGQLACQPTFASCLLQRMREVSYLGTVARLNQSVQDTTNLMNENITAIMEQEESLQKLKGNSTQLQEMAAVFKKSTKSVRRRMMLNNAKHGAILGAAITTGVAIVVIPPVLVAL